MDDKKKKDTSKVKVSEKATKKWADDSSKYISPGGNLTFAGKNSHVVYTHGFYN